ncbi:MAG: ATP-dependent DNA helicase RecG [Deferribacteres bacterium]|nr:ATP-dependent DNA helicase RecG [candidate division KSB1 bacterium]MCB9502237.1 ATP-dependent DNA helicase RecG [Deferribacteres bacterium]
MPTLKSIDIRFVKGVGEKRAALLKEHGVGTLEDLIYLFPRRYLDRTTVKPLRLVQEGEETTVVGVITSVEQIRGKQPRFIATVSDGSGFIQCVWFKSLHIWRRIFKVGESFAFFGKIGYFRGLQLVHPEYDHIDSDGNWNSLNTGTIVPVYPSSEKLRLGGLQSRALRRLIKASLELYDELVNETLPLVILQKNGLIDLKNALRIVHSPESQEELLTAQKRLKFDEFFYLELILALRRQKMHTQAQGIAFADVGNKTRQLIKILPYELTEAQKRVCREIWDDMHSPMVMNRLVQGDVGSGKTIVALIAMLMAIENGYQAALMAPTEILAEQHFRNIDGMLQEIGVRTVLLLGGQKKKVREQYLGEIKTGVAQVIIGTHALIQETVEFKQLGLAIIDEQHRFGVAQRGELQKKGEKPDVLVMTATPIPRTLSMTVYGDLDVSIIDELPKGRKPIRTVWRPSHKRKEIYHYIRDELVQGAQVYIVFPLIEESEKIDLRAATEFYEKVKVGFFDQFEVGLLHGRMKSVEKDAVMGGFKNGKLHVLVSTTVIEVGVDVPNATIMAIEHAERFGLTQLHQLRGRVGRGEKESICILIADTPLNEEAKRRINTMCETNDGFKIAEVDLEIRGPGEMLGTRQSGLPEFRIGNIITDTDILERAREEAFRVVEDEVLLQETMNRADRWAFFHRYLQKLEFARIS